VSYGRKRQRHLVAKLLEAHHDKILSNTYSLGRLVDNYTIGAL
jgi:hypothetical protein